VARVGIKNAMILAMLRRSALPMAALLALMGPMPVSACALIMGMPADCAPPVPVESHCEGMPAEPTAPPEPVPAGDPDCCDSLAAPLPDANVKIAPADALAASLVEIPATPVTSPVWAAADFDSPPAPSPPDLQTLLCVFLI